MGNDLGHLFAFWNPRYRGSLVLLLALGLVSSGLVYAQNTLIGLFLPSLVDGGGGAPVAAASGPSVQSEGRVAAGDSGGASSMGSVSAGLGVSAFALVLGSFIIVSLLSAAADFARNYFTGRLSNRASGDAEAAVLHHLLHKNDVFFSHHSPSETANRLGMDLQRVCDRRTSIVNAWSCVLLALGSLIYFIQHDAILSLVALAGCVGGAAWTYRGTRGVKREDAEYLRLMDRSKSHFEDVLRAAPEIQVGRLFDKVGRGFRLIQAERSGNYMRYVNLTGLLTAVYALSRLVAFVAMILVVAWRAATRHPGAAMDLVPVIVFALPQLFTNAAQLVFVRVGLQLAQTSMDRLLEYESRDLRDQGTGQASDGRLPAAEPAVASPPSAESRAAEPLTAIGATYRYSGVGGVSNASATFAPGTWVAVVGGAGCGKSTFMQLLLGRLRPQAGQVLYGSVPLEGLPGTRASAIFSFMPQSAALLNASFEQNLLFGRPEADSELSPPDLELIDAVGLGTVCRLKALDMHPAQEPVACDLAALRQRVRQQLGEKCGAAVAPYEEGRPDPDQWVVEHVLRARCDREKAPAILLAPVSRKSLTLLSRSGFGDRLARAAQDILRQSRQLLELPNRDEFLRLAPIPLDENLWRLRTASVHLCEAPSLRQKDRLALVQIALTSEMSECPGLDIPVMPRGDGDAGVLRGLFEGSARPFEPDRIHPFLTWRENLCFGSVGLHNSREGRLVDQTCLACADEAGLGGVLLRWGLKYSVGRMGTRISGGQGQLVSLSRALLRRTPVLVLDEPTSALDPAGRQRVADFLRAWRAGRTIITVSHDPEFVRQADQVLMLDSGRLVAAGAPAELAQTSEAYRNIMRRT